MDAPALTGAETPAGRVTLDLSLGNVANLSLRAEGREMAPLHRAPWADAPQEVPDATPPVERRLSGDFLCAPFGAGDVEPAPPHGWPANGAWSPLPAPPGGLAARLGRRVMGATVTKRLSLGPDAPLLYQEHLIEGGTGGLTVAHHPMIRMARGGRLCASPKRLALTPEAPLEPGRGALRYPAEANDLAAFPGAAGPVDLTRLPIGRGTEDFVTLVEAPGAGLGWTAVIREAEDDIVFVLKDPRVLPVTMLWHSNGGRDHAPWNGRHRGVLGVEDGCAEGAGGHAAALRPNRLTAMGVPTALPLAPGRTHRIAHVLGALPRRGCAAVADIRIDGAELVVATDGPVRRLPFRAGFFQGGA